MSWGGQSFIYQTSSAKLKSRSFVRRRFLLVLLVALLLLTALNASATQGRLSSEQAAAAPSLLWVAGGHAGGIGRAAISPDGQILATADYGEIELWRYSDGQLMATIGAPWIDMVKTIKFSPDGQFIVAGGTWIPGQPASVSSLRMWRVSDRTLVRQFNPGSHYDARSVSFSADGTTLAVATSISNVLIFNVSTGVLLQTLGPFAGNAVALSPDGSLVAATGADQFGDPPSVNIWRVSDGSFVTKLTGLNFISDTIAFSPNGQYLAAGDWGGNGNQGKVLVWQTPTFQPLYSLTIQFTSVINSLTFSQDSQLIAAAGGDDIVLWRLSDGGVARKIYGNIYAAIWSLVFSGDTLFAGGAQSISHVWRVSDGTWLRDIGGDRAFVTDVAFSPDGQLFASNNGLPGGGGIWSVEIFRSSDGVGIRGLSFHEDVINSIAFSPDGQLIASAAGSQPPDTRDPTIDISKVSNGVSQRILPGHQGGTTAVAFSPDGQFIASGGRDRIVALWRVSDGSVARVMRGHANWISEVVFSPDGQMLASGSGDATVKLWNTSDGSLIRTLAGTGYPVSGVAFSPDGQTLAISFSLGNLQLWRVSDGTLLRTIPGDQANGTTMNSPAFSRDGSVLVASSQSYPPVIWFWRVADGTLLQTYTQETGWVQPSALAVSPDGTQLGIGRYDAIVEMARFPTFAPTAALASISGRITTSDGAPLGGVVVELSGAMSARTISDASGAYFFGGLPVQNFYSVHPVLANYTFTPTEHAFSLLSDRTDAAFSANRDSSDAANPIDADLFFVRQHYLDFLDREPDAGGLAYWTSQIEQCGTDATCIRNRRIDVSAAYFIEAEFQQTGSFIYRLYKASYGARPSYSQFTGDRARVVGGSNLEASKAALAEEFVARTEFKAAYPESLSNADFVNKLLDAAGLAGQESERQAYVNLLDGGGTRAQVLRSVAESDAFKTREYNSAFVLMQYFGYLRRDPDEGGYQFWLNVLNHKEPNNYRGMVCSFLTSAEYQKRFASVMTHTNAECGQ
ncbi:MAG: DUF4214 domain-containing protein [Pyrinomonadaceae bacterium]